MFAFVKKLSVCHDFISSEFCFFYSVYFVELNAITCLLTMKRKKENEHAQLHWSKIRDAVLGPSSLLKSDENVWLNSEGYYDEESVEPLVLHHGMIYL